MAMRLPSACAASTAAFISSYVNVWTPLVSAPVPVEPYILMTSAPESACVITAPAISEIEVMRPRSQAGGPEATEPEAGSAEATEPEAGSAEAGGAAVG